MSRHLRLWMLAALLWLPQAQAADTVGQAEPAMQTGLPAIAVAELPAEARNRGVRRIVCGPLPECYYTADHYQTFKRIRESP